PGAVAAAAALDRADRDLRAAAGGGGEAEVAERGAGGCGEADGADQLARAGADRREPGRGGAGPGAQAGRPEGGVGAGGEPHAGVAGGGRPGAVAAAGRADGAVGRG